MKLFTPVKNGLWDAKHWKKMGDSIYVFGSYLSLMGAHKDKVDSARGEICVLVYPESIMKRLDISFEDLLKHTHKLEQEDYIEFHDLTEKESDKRWAICIKKYIFN